MVRRNSTQMLEHFLEQQQRAEHLDGIETKAAGFAEVLGYLEVIKKEETAPFQILENLLIKLIHESRRSRFRMDATKDVNTHARHYWRHQAFQESIKWINNEKLEKGDAKWIG